MLLNTEKLACEGGATRPTSPIRRHPYEVNNARGGDKGEHGDIGEEGGGIKGDNIGEEGSGIKGDVLEDGDEHDLSRIKGEEVAG